MEELNHLVVYLTLNCNLKCKYCYYHIKEKSKPDKNKILKKILDFLSFPFENKKITFLGGEPLIYFDVLKYLIIKIRNINKNIPIFVFTNGTLLDREKIKFFQDSGVKIILSLDGRKKDNDKFRKANFSVFDKVFKNIKGFDKSNFTVSMTVLPQTAKNLSRNIDFLYKKGFRSIGWSLDYSANWEEKNIKELKMEMLKLKAQYLKMIKENKDLYEFSNCYEIIENLISRKTYSCSNIILLPDGNFYICDKIITCPKSIRKRFRFEIDKNGKISIKRKNFFDSMLKNGIISNQLFCPVGIYLYYRFLKNYKGKKLKENFKKSISLMETIQSEKKKLISDLLKYPFFKKRHNL